MDTPRWESTATAKKLIAELRGIGQQLISLQEQISAIRDATEATSKQEDSQHEPPDEPLKVEVRSELYIPESIQRDQSTQNKYQNWIQGAVAMGTWCAFIAAAIYAGIAAYQLHETALGRDQVERSVILGIGQLAIANRNAKIGENQLRDFKYIQIGVLNMEELVTPKNMFDDDHVSFKLVNRGNSLVRINVASNEDNHFIGGSGIPDWQQIKKEMGVPLKPDPNGEIISPGRFKTYDFSVPNHVEVARHDRTFAIWYRWSYLDIFNETHQYGFCFFYRPINDPGVIPCPFGQAN
jgi:hypothetical protein